jgi:phage gp46-like protein
MTADVAFLWNDTGTAADWQLLGAGMLASAPPIQTAVLVSLFTDNRAKPDDRLVGDTDRRGWWGGQIDDQPIGSRLWLLRRAKRLPETLKLAQDYIREALAWLIEDGLAARVDVTASWLGASRINAIITLHRANGTNETVTADWAWQGG